LSFASHIKPGKGMALEIGTGIHNLSLSQGNLSSTLSGQFGDISISHPIIDVSFIRLDGLLSYKYSAGASKSLGLNEQAITSSWGGGLRFYVSRFFINTSFLSNEINYFQDIQAPFSDRADTSNIIWGGGLFLLVKDETSVMLFYEQQTPSSASLFNQDYKLGHSFFGLKIHLSFDFTFF
jgi:hypothetical protein